MRHSHARHTAPYHPQPTPGLCQGPCGSGGHCRGRGLPQGDHNGPKEATAGPRHNSSTLPRPRPVGHQSTPWPHQTPTKHPRGPAHHPARLWWPWAASGVAKRAKTGQCDFFTFFLPAGCAPGLECPGGVISGLSDPSMARGLTCFFSKKVGAGRATSCRTRPKQRSFTCIASQMVLVCKPNAVNWWF